MWMSNLISVCILSFWLHIYSNICIKDVLTNVLIDLLVTWTVQKLIYTNLHNYTHNKFTYLEFEFKLWFSSLQLVHVFNHVV